MCGISITATGLAVEEASSSVSKLAQTVPIVWLDQLSSGYIPVVTSSERDGKLPEGIYFANEGVLVKPLSKKDAGINNHFDCLDIIQVPRVTAVALLVITKKWVRFGSPETEFKCGGLYFQESAGSSWTAAVPE